MRSAHYPQTEAPTPVFSWLRRGRQPLVAALLTSIWLLSGCSSSGSERATHSAQRSPHYGEPTAISAISNEVLIRAISLVGTPYRYGGTSPEGGFDCSGLVDYVFLDAAGLRLPRSTRDLIELDAPEIRRSHLQPGDLVFFNPGGGRTSHIGIYVGEDRFVHAPSAGGTVRLDRLDTDYWDRAYKSAKRVLR